MRLEGWESRLAAVIEDARARPYVLGEHDCFRVTCRVIEACTGINRWPELCGYKTKGQALRCIATRGKSFTEAGDWFFGRKSIQPLLAQRGDIVALTTEVPVRNAEGYITSTYDEFHLGVVTGKNFVCLAADGLIERPVKSALCAWRVG